MPKKTIYLDYAAATPLDKAVLEAMQPYFSELFYNPSAEYSAAKEVREAIERARAKVGHWLGVRGAEIIFTAGGTEANNLAISGVMRKYPESNVVVSAVEHESILEPAKLFKHKIAPVKPDGRIDLGKLKSLIDDKTVLVSIMQANNEVGTIQPIRDVSKMIANIRAERKAAGNKTPIYLHTDACQAANYLDLHAERLGVDMLTLNGGKIYGPKQSGLLYAKPEVQLMPLIVGGGQERNLRSGTEQVAGIIGFAAALDKAQLMKDKEVKRLQVLQKEFINFIEKLLPQAVINGSLKHRLPNNVHITLPGCDNERLIFALDELGVLAAMGSACSASNEEPSHVLKAMGASEEDAKSSLRFSMGRETDQASIKKTVENLKSVASRYISD